MTAYPAIARVRSVVRAIAEAVVAYHEGLSGDEAGYLGTGKTS